MNLSEKITNAAKFTGENTELINKAEIILKDLITQYNRRYCVEYLKYNKGFSSSCGFITELMVINNIIIVAIVASLIAQYENVGLAGSFLILYLIATLFLYCFIYAFRDYKHTNSQRWLKNALCSNKYTITPLTALERVNELCKDPFNQAIHDNLVYALQEATGVDFKPFAPLTLINREMLERSRKLVWFNESYEGLTNEEKANVIVVRTLMDYFKV